MIIIDPYLVTAKKIKSYSPQRHRGHREKLLIVTAPQAQLTK